MTPATDATLPVLHFVHGNSFPTGTYQVFLDHLREHYHIQALEIHGHNPAFPVSDCWPELCQELIAALELHAQPVILVGHSLGGMLSLMAARLRPDLVRCVVMLDSPVVSGWRAKLLQFAKKTGLDKRFSPAQASEKRREYWPDAESAFQHFVSKAMFTIWPKQVLRDYIQYGTQAHPEGLTLRFKRQIETMIYRTLPHNMGQVVDSPYPVPVGFIAGLTSKECQQAGLGATKRLVGENFIYIPGGHLYPMESPQLAATSLHVMIRKLLGFGWQ
jgi:pimeloyl-ACP methyl ester carboxylesterase